MINFDDFDFYRDNDNYHDVYMKSKNASVIFILKDDLKSLTPSFSLTVLERNKNPEKYHKLWNKINSEIIREHNHLEKITLENYGKSLLFKISEIINENQKEENN